MAKKKGKPQVINNIDKLNIEIDYDKLAEAIAKAQKITEEKPMKNKKCSFLKAIWLILINKEPKDGNKTAVLLAETMSYIFNFIAICCVVLVALFVWALFAGFGWSNEPFYLTLQIFSITIVLGGLLSTALIFRGVANEIKAEKDRDYIISVFSGIVSLAALIVALVALFRGVG